MNIFVEGLQGSGKSTLVQKLHERLPDYQVYREGDYNPLELAWCSYMTEAQFAEAICRYSAFENEIRNHTIEEDTHRIVTYTRIFTEQRDFYQFMEQYEIYNNRVPYAQFHDIILGRYEKYQEKQGIFECSLFQNAMECMMLFYRMSDEAIMDFYREVYQILKEKQMCLYYLNSDKIKENVLQIKKERCDEKGVELWFPLMMEYLKESPYGKEHGYSGIDDLIAHLYRRRTLEMRIIQEIMKEHTVILQAKNYHSEQLPKQQLFE